ncbi:MAG: hypothetical protein HOW97_26940 [Catenulispora sp.]|nr:hypothetical protein [Catenulispora sp.]
MVSLPTRRVVEPPPLGGRDADEAALPLGAGVEGAPPFGAVVPTGVPAVPPGALPGVREVPLADAVGVPAASLDVPGSGEPPSLVEAVPVVPAGPVVVLDDDATVCW